MIRDGSAYLHQKVIEERTKEDCVKVFCEPYVDPDTGEVRECDDIDVETGERAHTWECPFDGQFFRYRYNSVAEAKIGAALQGSLCDWLGVWGRTTVIRHGRCLRSRKR